MYRGVTPVSFDVKPTTAFELYENVFDTLLAHDLVEVGDRVIFTKGDLEGVSGGTNSMTIIEVTASS